LKAGDIFFVDLEPTIGREQRGVRPVFLITAEPFNKQTGTAIIAAITNGGQFARRIGVAVELTGTGTQTTGVIRCDQVRTLDLSARGARFVESAPPEVLARVLNTLVGILVNA
jgi:mRNA interferase ChpB